MAPLRGAPGFGSRLPGRLRLGLRLRRRRRLRLRLRRRLGLGLQSWLGVFGVIRLLVVGGFLLGVGISLHIKLIGLDVGSVEGDQLASVNGNPSTPCGLLAFHVDRLQHNTLPKDSGYTAYTIGGRFPGVQLAEGPMSPDNYLPRRKVKQRRRALSAAFSAAGSVADAALHLGYLGSSGFS